MYGCTDVPLHARGTHVHPQVYMHECTPTRMSHAYKHISRCACTDVSLHAYSTHVPHLDAYTLMFGGTQGFSPKSPSVGRVVVKALLCWCMSCTCATAAYTRKWLLLVMHVCHRSVSELSIALHTLGMLQIDVGVAQFIICLKCFKLMWALRRSSFAWNASN